MIQIENEWLKVEISSDGAEIRKVKNKKNNLDYMWTGDETYWGRVSPVLFPIVGGLKDAEYQLNGQTYSMTQHGFLRDVVFELDEQSEKDVTFSFESAGRFTQVYPYEFKALIHYILKEDSLIVKWDIHNLNEEKMYFSIGAHPAFKVPLLNHEKMEDYSLEFTKAKNKPVIEYEIKDALTHEKGAADNISTIPLANDLFINDAIIFSNIDSIKLVSSKSEHAVEVIFEDFPFVGVWSKYDEEDATIAPFVCIEPWYGIADMHDTSGDFKKKHGINELEVGEVFKADYKMRFE